MGETDPFPNLSGVSAGSWSEQRRQFWLHQKVTDEFWTPFFRRDSSTTLGHHSCNFMFLLPIPLNKHLFSCRYRNHWCHLFNTMQKKFKLHLKTTTKKPNQRSFQPRKCSALGINRTLATNKGSSSGAKRDWHVYKEHYN